MLRFTRRFSAADAQARGIEAQDSVRLDWNARSRTRARHRISEGAGLGTEIGFDLPRGTVLVDGDVLVGRALVDSGARHDDDDDGNEGVHHRATLRIRAALEPALTVRAESTALLMRIAYHLGNRHVPLQLSHDAGDLWLRLKPDHVLEEMVAHLGGRTEAGTAAFQPEGGAYSVGSVHADARGHETEHGHSHRHGAEDDQLRGLDHVHGHDHDHAPDHAPRHAPRIHDFIDRR